MKWVSFNFHNKLFFFEPPGGEWGFTFWTGSRCGQVRLRRGFHWATRLPLVFFTFSESSNSRKEQRPPQSTRPSAFTVSLSRRRPRFSWVTTTLSNSSPYSSLEPRPTEDLASLTNSALDKERDEPVESCTRSTWHNVSTVSDAWTQRSADSPLMSKTRLFVYSLTRKMLCSFR